MNSRMLVVLAILGGAVLLSPLELVAQKNPVESPMTVIGPRNPWLADGARAIEDGNVERGVELSELGLANAQGSLEQKAALSNLCAGYLLLDKPEKALDYCNRVLELDGDFWRGYNNRALVYLTLGRHEEAEADIRAGQALRPKSSKLRRTRALYLDTVEPVEPVVEIDDRREHVEDGSGDDDTE